MSMSTTPVPGPKVRLRDGALTVDMWSTREPAIIASAQRAQDAGVPAGIWLENCVRAGSAASLIAASGIEVARAQETLDALAAGVGRSVNDAMARLTSTVDQAIDPTQGAIALAVQAGVDRLAAGVANLITGPDARVPARIRAEVANAGAEMLGEIQRVLATQQSVMAANVRDDRAALVAQVQQSVQGQQAAILAALGDVRAAMAIAEETRSVRSRLTSAGADFEAEVVELLGQIAADAGDSGATACGTSPTASGSKAGDATVDLSEGGRIVIEAKRRQSGLSTDAWRRELQSARTNRDAEVAIGVTTPETMPTKGRSLVRIGHDLVVAYDGSSVGYGRDLLASAYLLARLMVAVQRRPGDAPDVVAAAREIEAITRQVELLATAQRHAGQIARTAERLGASVGEVREAIAAHAANALALLSASAAPSSPVPL